MELFVEIDKLMNREYTKCLPGDKMMIVHKDGFVIHQDEIYSIILYKNYTIYYMIDYRFTINNERLMIYKKNKKSYFGGLITIEKNFEFFAEYGLSDIELKLIERNDDVNELGIKYEGKSEYFEIYT